LLQLGQVPHLFELPCKTRPSLSSRERPPRRERGAGQKAGFFGGFRRAARPGPGRERRDRRRRSPIAAAAAVAAISLQKRPDAAALALWLADAVLAHRVRWPSPVPLIAGHIRRSDLRAAARPDTDGAWQTGWALAYAGAAAADLYAELARRAHHLVAVAPKLRGRDAARRVEILLTEDAQAATAGASATDRSSRRLFDRLVAIGAARELTGRTTFRLYGL
jgi:hypothetical protein